MTPLKWNQVATAGLAGAALMGFLAIMLKGMAKTVCGILCGVFLVGTFVVLAVFWRCPECKKSLPYANSAGMKHCPHCAASLDQPAHKE